MTRPGSAASSAGAHECRWLRRFVGPDGGRKGLFFNDMGESARIALRAEERLLGGGSVGAFEGCDLGLSSQSDKERLGTRVRQDD